MLRKTLLFCLMIVSGFTAIHAQNAELEAKAAYLLAEENYQKGQMPAALDYLDRATTKQTGNTAQYCWLRVMILKEMAAKDISYHAKLDEAILAFEKTPDIANFNQEKSLAVMKVKLERKRYIDLDTKSEQQLISLQQSMGWLIGMSKDSMVILNKDKFDAYFKKHPDKNGRLDSSEVVQFYSDPQEKKVFEILTIKKGVLKGYNRILVDQTGQDSSFFATVRQWQSSTLDLFRKQLGYVPDITVATEQMGLQKTSYYRYKWQSKSFIVWLVIKYTSFQSGYSSDAMLTILPAPVS